jgi:predicted nucleic acid-binding protein
VHPAGRQVVLVDACVLAEAAVSDLLFRLSTAIECIELRWSSQIWDETRKTLIRKLGWSPELVDRRIYAATSWFGDSMVVDFEHLIEGCKNHPKDRHVLAAAIHSNATHLITYNTKDFPVDMSSVQIVQPSDFFVSVLKHHPETVIRVLHEITQRTSRPMEEVLGRFAWTIRGFSVAVSDYLNVEVVDIPPREWRRQ